jgi:hypothetical protein
MKLKAIGCLAALLLVVGEVNANEKPASCVVYFSVLENDVVPAHLSIPKMNKPQSSWYERHGDRDKYAGICYVESQAGAPTGVPLYAVVWGEHSASEPYIFSSGTEESGSKAGPHDNASSATKKDYVADGWLAVWDPKTKNGKGSFVAVGPLQIENHTSLNTASTSLLMAAMEQISQREKDKLAAAATDPEPYKTVKGGNSREERNGWTEITITPLKSGPPVGTQTASTTPQSSPATAPSSASTTPREYSAGQPSVVPSTVAVSSTPPGADIFVDEDFVGNTPSTVNVTAGRHVVTVIKSGFQSWARVVNFSGGLITLNAELAGGASVLPAVDPPATTDSTKEASIADVSTKSSEKVIGWIGISTKNGLGGALVTSVIAEGPAARAGIHVGDIILSLDGQLINGKDFDTQVAGLKPGTRVPVDYTRGSAAHEVWVTVGTQN